MDENQIWDVRTFVYQRFAKTTRPPLVEETASYFGLTREEAVSAYEELQRRHAVFLQPGITQYPDGMAILGCRRTPFKVQANGRTYFANCASGLFRDPCPRSHADAEIDAVCAQSGGRCSVNRDRGADP